MRLADEGGLGPDGGSDPQAGTRAEDVAPPVAASGRVEDLDPDLAAQLKEKLTQLENFGLLSVDGLLEPREDEAGAGSPADST